MKWPEEREMKLKACAATGMSASEIGKVLGVTRNAVIGKARRCGIKLNPPNRDHLNKDELNGVIEDLLYSGWSMVKIGRKHGINIQAVSNINRGHTYAAFTGATSISPLRLREADLMA